MNYESVTLAESIFNGMKHHIMSKGSQEQDVLIFKSVTLILHLNQLVIVVHLFFLVNL